MPPRSSDDLSWRGEAAASDRTWRGEAAARADLAACRALLRDGSKSFHAASLLLPERVRLPASALYAFCRLADDAVDLTANRAAGLTHTRERLDRAYAGAPLPHPVDRAFARNVARHRIPRDLPEALIEGLAWDADSRRYDTLPDLLAYAARVAGSVGAMMSLLMGARDPDALARACDLGAAMQLTNIARDVGEDAANGRLYLPISWLRDAGIEPDAWMRNPVASPPLREVVRRLLAEADWLYARGLLGVALLPPDCRPAIAAAAAIYAEIGHRVAGNGHDSVTARAVVPARTKLRLAARSTAAIAARRSTLATAPPLPELRFLVEAATVTPAIRIHPRASGASWWDLRARLLWSLDLLARPQGAGRDARDAVT